MVSDRNKGIQKIAYNHQNLPKYISFDNGDLITYKYNALGVKLQKVVTSGTNVTTTDYLSGFHYTNEGLTFFPTPEGYVKVTDGRHFDYVYNYLDHLGNIRLSYSFDVQSNEVKIIEENHYYPFGLKHQNYNTQNYDYKKEPEGESVFLKETLRKDYQYKYNGKEFQDELGLNLYDYGARNYDAAIGRWMNIDRKAESGYMLSPYQHSFNNPIMFIDNDGNWSVSVHYNMTSNALKNAGYGIKKSVLVGRYASVYADHPPQKYLVLNNATNRTSLGYGRDIDYSATRNSQNIDYDPHKSTTYNYNIWHSMRSNKEAELYDNNVAGGISERDAMLRGMQFGWDKIFESAKEGKISELGINSKGMQALGQGLHALQDAWAHKGVSMKDHDAVNDAFNTNGGMEQAEAMTASAIVVHQLLSGEWGKLGDTVNLRTDGMSNEQWITIQSKIQEYLNSKK